MDTESSSALPRQPGLPVRKISVNAIVALNMGYFRRAAGLSQQELGDLIGWGKSMVSTAERSADARRVRQFSADDLVKIAAALRVPLGGLFLPPEDSGTAVRYVLDPPLPGEKTSEVTGLLRYAFPDFGEEYGSSPVGDAYRQRLIAAGLGRLDKSMDLALHVLAEAQRVARHQAEQITGDARARAESLERDAQERHRQAMGELVKHRAELERRIDDLRAFEAEYRSRLRLFLESQYRELWVGTEGFDADELLEAMRRKAGGRPAGNVTAVLLGEDGTYDVLRSDQVADIADEAGKQGSPADQSQWVYDAFPPDYADRQGYDEPAADDPTGREERGS